MYIDVFGSNLSGILPLQHFRYNRPQGGQEGWDLDLRAHKRCVRVVGRWDTGGGIGQWEIERESVGDLCGGLCWKSAGKDKRPIAYWSFIVPTVLGEAASDGTATRAAGGNGVVKAGDMVAMAQADQQFNEDGRLVPIPVKARVFKGEGPKNPNALPAAPGVGAKDGERPGEVLQVGMGTRFLQFQQRPPAPGEPYIGVGIGTRPITWQTPRVDPAAQPNIRNANPAIGALKPGGQ